MKVTLVLVHTSEVPLIDTEGVTTGFTVIVILLLVAGLPVAQGDAFEVSTTKTKSPFASVVLL